METKEKKKDTRTRMEKVLARLNASFAMEHRGKRRLKKQLIEEHGITTGRQWVRLRRKLKLQQRDADSV